REDRYSLRSDTVPVQVLPLPGTRSVVGDPPAVAQGLSLELRLDPPNGRVGEPMAVTATLSGVGNVALWPEPVIGWPPGFRAYAGETGTRVEARDGRIAGAKTFHYLVMPDSAGSFQLPPGRFPHYAIAAGVPVPLYRLAGGRRVGPPPGPSPAHGGGGPGAPGPAGPAAARTAWRSG